MGCDCRHHGFLLKTARILLPEAHLKGLGEPQRHRGTEAQRLKHVIRNSSPCLCDSVVTKDFLMADIIPFRALRYNLSKVSPGEVLTQPYDKINPAMQERYYQLSPYNLVRIMLGKSEPGDNDGENVY